MIGRRKSAALLLAGAAGCAASPLVNAATITNIVDLNFSGSLSGTAYTEPGGTYASAAVYADSLGTYPTISGGAFNNINDTSTIDDPGLSVVPAGGTAGQYTYSLYNTLTTSGTNFVYEAEISGATSTQGAGNTANLSNIIAWEIGGHPILDLRLSNNTIDAVVGVGAGVSVTGSAQLAPNTETHVGLVYVAPTSSTSSASITLYTINDATHSATAIGSATVAVSSLTESNGANDTLNDQIGLLNSAYDYSDQSASNQNRGFDGSLDGVIVGTFTGTFNPSTDFQLSSVVPEPSAVALLASAAAAALRRRRRAR